MQAEIGSNKTSSVRTFRAIEWVAFAWILLALSLSFLMPRFLGAPLPIFTMIWLVVPLIVLVKTRSASRIGIRQIPWKQFAKYGTINFLLLAFAMILFEPWSHTYQALLTMVFSTANPDLTFSLVSRYPGISGLAGMFLFSITVTLFGEELFFRGWLLQFLLKRMRPVWAIVLQALLFSIPQSIAAVFLSPVQGILYILVYSWLSIGVIGGWAAWRTNSIWPSLVSAALMNLVLTTILH